MTNKVEVDWGLLEWHPIVRVGIESGYCGNGCGNAWWNNLLARFFMWRHDVDFRPACLLHDAGIDLLDKSEDNRVENDEMFHRNCMALVWDGGFNEDKLALAERFFSIVAFNSYNNYWKHTNE